MSSMHVPDLVERRALANGEAGRRWLADLPERVRAIADRWQLVVGNVFSGGTAGLVVAVTDGEGCPAVLKVPMLLDGADHDAFARAVIVHRLAGGNGCAALLASDDEALLLERLGPNVHDLDLTLVDVLGAVTSALSNLWRPVPPHVALPTGADQAAWLATSITRTWDVLEHPCPRPLVDRAVRLCDDLAEGFDPATAVLVHGDAHGWNTVSDGPGWKLVDPEGLRSSREHDLAVLLREYNEVLLAGDTARLVRDRAEWLASRCDADSLLVWKWGFVERVSTGLAGWRHLGPDVGRPFLTVAERTR